MKSSLSFSNRKGGSAFITVILFTFMIAVLIGSIISWSRNERLLTVRNAHWLEARTAAEALAEYGFAQVSHQFDGHSTAPTFDPALGTTTTNFPMQLPPGSTTSSANSFWDQSGHVDLSTSSTNKLELIASTSVTYPANGFYYVDPTVVNNANDPLKGQLIKRNDVTVVARASVLSPEGGPPVKGPVMKFQTDLIASRLDWALRYRKIRGVSMIQAKSESWSSSRRPGSMFWNRGLRFRIGKPTRCAASSG